MDNPFMFAIDQNSLNKNYSMLSADSIASLGENWQSVDQGLNVVETGLPDNCTAICLGAKI